MTPLHFGQLHPFETWLALILAFGPFLLLAVVVAVRRRQAIDAEGAPDAPNAGPPPSPIRHTEGAPERSVRMTDRGEEERPDQSM